MILLYVPIRYEFVTNALRLCNTVLKYVMVLYTILCHSLLCYGIIEYCIPVSYGIQYIIHYFICFEHFRVCNNI